MRTDTQCRNAKCRDKPYKLTDGQGLHLEIKPNGVKAWRYRFKLGKGSESKESLFAIGDYTYAPPGETVEQARHGATVAALRSPKQEKNAQKRGRW